jgi:hypothetical protein
VENLDRRMLLAGVGLVGAAAALSQSANAGQLTPPPGPVAPTGATPVQSLTGDGTSLYVINQPGAYVLTANIQGVVGKHGIVVAADNVTINLAGFTLSGVVGSVTGITNLATNRGISVVNGRLTDWPSGGIRLVGTGCTASDVTVLNSGNAIVLEKQSGTRISRCSVHDITTTTTDACLVADTVESCTLGAITGPGVVTGINAYSLVSACTIENISGITVTGISVNGLAIDCVVLSVGGTTIVGILGNADRCVVSAFGSAATTSLTGIQGSLVANSYVSGISQPAASALASQGISAFTAVNCEVLNGSFNSTATTHGIRAAQLVQGCSVTNVKNTGTGSALGIGLNFFGNSTGLVSGSRVDNSESGILVGNNCQVLNCNVSGCDGNGIVTGMRSSVVDCTSAGNGTVVTGAGITVDIRSVVTRCNASDNTGDGIAVQGGCHVEGCTAENSTLGSGIRVMSGAGSRIEANHVRDNHRYGIEAGVGDVIARNTSGNNLLGNYLPASGANFGTLQTPASATNPMANF